MAESYFGRKTKYLNQVWIENEKEFVYIILIIRNKCLGTRAGNRAYQYGQTRPKHNLFAGLKYLLTNDLQLDAIAGFSVFKSESDNFVALEVAYRFKNKQQNRQQNRQS